MIIACLIFVEFLSQITIISSSTESNTISQNILRKIPGENISWVTQREEKYLYADKTVYLERLLEKVNEHDEIFFYLTRPRRFGKSSFLDMARHFFNGDHSLFEGLHIGKRGNLHFCEKRFRHGVPEEGQKWIQCPVIHLDFRDMDSFDTIDDFKESYTRQLVAIMKSYKLEYDFKYGIDISSLIFELEFKFQLPVVVLIDEYDSPFQRALQNWKNPELAGKTINFLDGIFGCIKSNNNHLRLVLVLGVSRLAILHGGSNNYLDLTYEEDFAGAFGFTTEEIQDFRPEIAHQFDLKSEEEIVKFISKLREQYDGYNFTFQYNDGKNKNVLNPVSIMKCLKNKKIGCYWSKIISVDKVIRRLYFSQQPLEKLEHLKLLRKNIEKKCIYFRESIPLEILMLQYGYFTIESYNEETKEVVLNFPNNEIKTALQNNINQYKPSNDRFLSEEHGWLYELKWHMKTGNLEGTMNTLTNLFDTRFSKTFTEGINEFSTTTPLVNKFFMAGIFCRESVKFMKELISEDEAGDVDLMTTNLKKNFIISIKDGKSATYAMQQLIDYLKTYPITFLEAINQPKEAWFIGINFGKETGGTIDQWVAVPFKKGILQYDECRASLPIFCDTIEKYAQEKPKVI